MGIKDCWVHVDCTCTLYLRKVVIMFHSPLLVSEAPRNLMTIPTNTTVVVTWEAPSDPNGVIFAYSVTLQDSDMTVDDSQNESNTTCISIFDNLIPFSTYTVTVRPLTGDNGEIVGEPAMTAFMTDTGSKILELLHTHIVALLRQLPFLSDQF